MFGKKEENLLPEKEIFVETIPDDFYGGKNPVVAFKNVTETVDLKKNNTVLVTADEKKKFHEATAEGVGKGDWHLANLATNPKALAVFAGIVFVIAILGTGAYYFVKNTFLNKTDVNPTDNIPELVTLTTSTPTIPSEEIVEDNIVPVVPTSTEQEIVKEIPLDFPSTLLAESADLDDDGLTDLAEEEFQTDPGDFDTDKDKYPDGHEVFYLYNPKGFEPQKLIDSNLVKEYDNLNFSYQLYIPVNWAIGNVDEEGRQALFSTLSGENIEMRVFDLGQGEDFRAWFSRMALGQDESTLKDFETVGKFGGKMRSDGLVYYFVYNSKVYVLLYHTIDSSVVNYKAVISLVARSLNFGSIPLESIPQVLLTPVPTSTVSSTEVLTTTTPASTGTEENNFF